MLIAIGLSLNAAAGFQTLSTLRIPGVLQRIAVVYLLTALIVLYFQTSVRAVVAALLLLTHWAVLTLVPFGDHPGGVVSAQQNISAFTDAWLFGAHRLMPLNPEVGTIPDRLALLGVLAGQWLRAPVDERRRSQGWRRAVSHCWVSAWCGRVLPLNKPLWTGSFSLVTGGTPAALALARVFTSRWKWRLQGMDPTIHLAGCQPAGDIRAVRTDGASDGSGLGLLGFGADHGEGMAVLAPAGARVRCQPEPRRRLDGVRVGLPRCGLASPASSTSRASESAYNKRDRPTPFLYKSRAARHPPLDGHRISSGKRHPRRSNCPAGLTKINDRVRFSSAVLDVIRGWEPTCFMEAQRPFLSWPRH